MDIRLIGITLTLTVIKQCFCLPLGCSYNGTFYNDGNPIKAKDPCLSCFCRSGALICNLQVCATPPNPLPKNCFIVHKDNECCPHMLCEENHNDDNGIELRTAFKPKKTIERNDCIINGTAFAEGSAVGSPQLCEYCYCLKGEVKCLKPRCSQNFKDCKPIFHEPFCCPTHYDCIGEVNKSPENPGIPDDSMLKTNLKNYGCKRNGTVFLEGDMVPLVNNSRCESCYCMKGDIVCTPITCQIEPDLKDCEPLNTKDQCCPTAFNCEKTKVKNFMNSTINFSNVEEKSKGEPKKKVNETTKPLTVAFQGKNELDNGLLTTEKLLMIETSTSELGMESTEDSTNTEIKKYKINSNLSALTELQNNNKEVEMIKTTTIVTKENMIMTSPFPQTTLNVVEKIFSRNSEKLDVKNRAEEIETDLIYGEIFRNSSLHSDDYDTYDYNEPKLPPSLPNLVIFPFVAADAVVKEKTHVLEPNIIKKVDVSTGYYNNFYSPPIQAEGEFNSKDTTYFSSQSYGHFDNKKTSKFPSISGKCFFDGKEIWHGEMLPETEDCLSCACQHGELICKEITCKSVQPGCITIPEKNSCCGTTICDLGTSENTATNGFSITGSKNSIKLPNPIEEVTKTENIPDVSQFWDDISDSSLNPYTLKPVTVTYKNIVVDYYPEFSVTLPRDKIILTTHKNLLAESNLNLNVSPAQTHTFYTLTTLNTSEKISTEKYFTKSKNSIATTSKPSFLSELFMSWLGEDIKFSTTVPTTSKTKFKYSSKIKTDLDTPKQSTTNEVVTEKIKRLGDNKKANTSNPYFLDHSLIQKKNSIHNASTLETAQKTTGPSKIDSPPHFKDHHQQLLKSENKEDSKKNKKNQESEKKKSTQAEGSVNNFTTILKLAGCNIYGRMYRVGKIITELSGPCLECVCTSLGVQCNSLPC